MASTTDTDSITNSLMMAMDKEMRKYGLGPAFQLQHVGNRALMRTMVAAIQQKSKEITDDTRS